MGMTNNAGRMLSLEAIEVSLAVELLRRPGVVIRLSSYWNDQRRGH